jgi:LysR family glycine cleavage system transcriptional activator
MRRTLPPLENLWAFHIVAETGSLTAAAAVLEVTQPAVSKRLRDLEAALDCALVRRSANAISLTAMGGSFAAEIREGFTQLQAATQKLQSQTAPLRIRAYTTWALRWLIPRLSGFRDLHPGIDVEVSTSTAVVDLAREGVDAAIRTAPCGSPPSPHARQLQPVVVAPFATPALAAAHGTGGIAGGRLLGSKVRAGDWPQWQRHNGMAAQATPLLFESTTLAIQAAMEGLGIVICSTAFVGDELRTGRLASLPGRSLMTGDCYWLILPQGRIGAPLRIFADWLAREAAAESATTHDGAAGG